MALCCLVYTLLQYGLLYWFTGKRSPGAPLEHGLEVIRISGEETAAFEILPDSVADSVCSDWFTSFLYMVFVQEMMSAFLLVSSVLWVAALIAIISGNFVLSMATIR